MSVIVAGAEGLRTLRISGEIKAWDFFSTKLFKFDFCSSLKNTNARCLIYKIQ